MRSSHWTHLIKPLDEVLYAGHFVVYEGSSRDVGGHLPDVVSWGDTCKHSVLSLRQQHGHFLREMQHLLQILQFLGVLSPSVCGWFQYRRLAMEIYNPTIEERLLVVRYIC
jgi:hypothetical protein